MVIKYTNELLNKEKDITGLGSKLCGIRDDLSTKERTKTPIVKRIKQTKCYSLSQ